jgi:uncharacterized protein
VRKLLTSIILIIAGVYLVVCAAAFLLQRQLIYHPFKHILATPSAVGLAYRETKLTSPDGVEFIVWEVPADSAKLSVVYFHGNAENVSNNISLYQMLHGLGVTVFAVEYRGYASCTGTPSEDGITTDLRTFADYLRKALGPEGNVVVMGRSLGGAVAVKFADIYSVKGLILESTFNRMDAVAKQAFPYLPIFLLLREHYNSEEIVARMDKPVLVIHSREDEVIPFQLGMKLYDAAMGDKSFVEITDSHNAGLQTCAPILRKAYGAFLDRFRS